MFRRTVSLLLLPAVLLTQWASAGSCHCDHGRLPHFHLAKLALLHTAPTPAAPARKSCCGHHHHPQPSATPHHDAEHHDSEHHDEDAVTVPPALVHGMRCERWLAEAAQWAAPVVDCCQPAVTALVPLHGTHHPPPISATGACPLYLWHSLLLI